MLDLLIAYTLGEAAARQATRKPHGWRANWRPPGFGHGYVESGSGVHLAVVLFDRYEACAVPPGSEHDFVDCNWGPAWLAAHEIALAKCFLDEAAVAVVAKGWADRGVTVFIRDEQTGEALDA